jgi:hypothetical protein
MLGPHGLGARPAQSTTLTCILVARQMRWPRPFAPHSWCAQSPSMHTLEGRQLVARQMRWPRPFAPQTHGVLSLHRCTRLRGTTGRPARAMASTVHYAFYNACWHSNVLKHGYVVSIGAYVFTMSCIIFN